MCRQQVFKQMTADVFFIACISKNGDFKHKVLKTKSFRKSQPL